MADVITLIEQDHRQVEDLFERLKAAKDDRRQLLTELEMLLIPHTQAEEQAVYPTMETEGLETFDRGEAFEEHEEASQLLERLKTLTDDDTSFQSTLRELIDAVGHHVEEEENEMLPELRGQVDHGTLQRLAERFEQAKRGYLEAVQTARTDTGGSMPTGVAGAATGELLDLTKEELYEQAKKLDIDGRSKMNKKQLAKAISSNR